MTYTPINWQTGDTITAEKMNKMDNGWGFESTQLFSETVTTELTDGYNRAFPTYDQFVSNDTVVITVNGTDYEVSNTSTDPFATEYGAQWSNSLGNFDFSTYPFNYYSDQTGYNCFTMQTAGTYTVTVTADGIVTSSGFADAVNAVVDVSSSSGPWYYSAYIDSSVTIPANGTVEYSTFTFSTDGFVNGGSDVPLIVAGVSFSGTALSNPPTVASWMFLANSEGLYGRAILRNHTSSALTLTFGSITVTLVSFAEIIPW